MENNLKVLRAERRMKREDRMHILRMHKAYHERKSSQVTDGYDGPDVFLKALEIGIACSGGIACPEEARFTDEELSFSAYLFGCLALLFERDAISLEFVLPEEGVRYLRDAPLNAEAMRQTRESIQRILDERRANAWRTPDTHQICDTPPR